MREIKFRAWNRQLEKFELFELAGHAPITTAQIPARGSWNCFDDWEQYTGLKDKNGKEIYEGDKVQYVGGNIEHGEAEIKFDCGCFVFEWDSSKTSFIALYTTANIMGCASELEIIGNIHEKLPE
jgi:uncharacterized phage protein (TIGR01671 family)